MGGELNLAKIITTNPISGRIHFPRYTKVQTALRYSISEPNIYSFMKIFEIDYFEL